MNPVLPLAHLVPLALLVWVVAGWCVWRSTRDLPPGPRLLSRVLRMAGVGGVLALLTNPGDWLVEQSGRDAKWAVVVDTSASMATADLEGRDRWSEALRIAAAVESDAEEDAAPYLYTVDDGLLRHAGDVASLTAAPTGAATRLTRAGADLLDRHPRGNQDLAGVLWLTDGRETVPDEGEDSLMLQAQALGIPFHAVVLGAEVPTRDVSLSASRRHYVTFAGQPVRIGADLSARGMPDLECTVSLEDTAGVVMGSRTNRVRQGEIIPVSFSYTPGDTGHHELLLRTPEWPEEHIHHNNTVEVGITVLDGRIRVLLVEGLPHWESKFLAQLLRRQSHIDLTSVHRLSEDRYFRVAGREDEATEVDRPFPETLDELSAYDILIIGKGAEYVLDAERVEQVRRYMSDHGRSVLFCRGKPYHVAAPGIDGIEAMTWGDPIQRPFALRPTAAADPAGLSGQWLPAAADAVWRRLPSLSQARRIPQLHPFAQVLIEGQPEGEGAAGFPAVVGRRIGRGLSVAVNAEGMWEWDFIPRREEAAAFYDVFWIGLVQWAATAGGFLPGHAAALRLSESAVDPRRPVRVTLEARPSERPAEGSPRIRIWRGVHQVRTISLVPAGSDGSRWVSAVQLEDPGAYRFEGDFGEAGPKAGEAYLTVRPPVAEGDEVSADPGWMRAWCEGTGGSLVDAGRAVDLVQRITEPEPAYEDRTTWAGGWDRWWVAGPLMALFCAEWIVRRRNGLP